MLQHTFHIVLFSDFCVYKRSGFWPVIGKRLCYKTIVMLACFTILGMYCRSDNEEGEGVCACGCVKSPLTVSDLKIISRIRYYVVFSEMMKLLPFFNQLHSILW